MDRFILVYIFIASVTPVWILLQPRDYLNSYLLYAMIGGAVAGLLMHRPTLELSGFTGFNAGGKYLFPMLFVIVACGAISGFHSLVGSGTTSKQLDKEEDAKLIGYGGMLIEGVLGVIALITAAYIGQDKLAELLAAGGPVNVFSDGVGTFMATLGISFTAAKSFVALAISAFALTSLDTGTRLGRFIFQEMVEEVVGKENPIATNRYISTTITVILGGALAVNGWQQIWPIFGAANQLLAALALLAVAAYLAKVGKDNRMVVIPMVFMFTVTLTALVMMIMQNLSGGSGILLGFSCLLFLLALALIAQSYKVLTGKKEADQGTKIA